MPVEGVGSSGAYFLHKINEDGKPIVGLDETQRVLLGFASEVKSARRDVPLSEEELFEWMEKDLEQKAFDPDDGDSIIPIVSHATTDQVLVPVGNGQVDAYFVHGQQELKDYDSFGEGLEQLFPDYDDADPETKERIERKVATEHRKYFSKRGIAELDVDTSTEPPTYKLRLLA
jgi:hypothetical protein